MNCNCKSGNKEELNTIEVFKNEEITSNFIQKGICKDCYKMMYGKEKLDEVYNPQYYNDNNMY